MDDIEASETDEWRTHDRQLQGLTSPRQRRAQAVVDVGESAKLAARERGSAPLDDLLELYLKVSGAAAKRLVADSIHYVKTELDLVKPIRSGGIAFDTASHWPLST